MTNEAQPARPSPTIAITPLWYRVARAEIGVKEAVGAADNPRIIEYLRTVRLPEKLVHDATPHCSAFVNWCMEQAGVVGTKSAAARSWMEWGEPLAEPRLGCVVVFWRRTPTAPLARHGHVGLFVRREGTQIHVLGGNQNNRVSIAPYPEFRLLGYRWPKADTAPGAVA